MEEDIKSIINFLQHLGLIKEAKTIRDLLSAYKKLEEDYKALRREAYIEGIAHEQRREEEIINNYYIPKQKIKDIVDECIPKGTNLFTGEEEYQPNANANSFLTHEILELLEERGDKNV